MIEDGPHPELQCLRKQLQDMLASMSSFGPTLPKPPIIDSSFDSSADDVPRREAVRGMRIFKDSVKRDLDVLEKFLANIECARLPALSTNAPYLISVWKEAISAPAPVTAIWSTYSESGTALHPRKRGLPKEAGVKVDVVADGGRRWTRVNTTKNSRMLAEFREIDSYLTDSEGDDDEDELPSLAQTKFDNSVLRMGRSLLAAAKENPVPGTSDIPLVTLCLTRLDPSPQDSKEHDPRIPRTIEELRAMGIDVQLGEREDRLLWEPSDNTVYNPRAFHPTFRVNLDLSILIALVSDLTHAPLPTSPEDANARFTPGAEYVEWKKKRIMMLRNGGSLPADDEIGEPTGMDFVGRPSRALVTQVLQEMSKGLLDDMSERLSAVIGSAEFWTTPEAKERCLQIVRKIGGPKELRRAEALFAGDIASAEADYWDGSRYPKGFISLLPVCLLPAGQLNDTQQPPARDESGRPLSPFFRTLARTCRTILREETTPHPKSPFSPVASERAADDCDEIQRATVTKTNPKLTAHTVQSLLWGAVYGWTTLTANKTSIKAMLKEMRAGRNGALWDRSDETLVKDAGNDADTAAIWMVDPRSLAEGMRADFSSS
ncbi:uncharacterized protein PHACADRAFT_27911 [Phanerochaete carnosa HHB-10118-sp]|uniref:DUF1308 domain-containing protein n=1 Tax=Phanerochaete carnosa (strain HHB-10118-sp) TaxID=650164 RepID=K5W069_PHACS|nr:uncharacterized protein PHACADRAFT_27911 [Phanerochaete carnosa HHB-10118-sp]EKM57228.1 hypothetical protein PHACADRAFT_27911 [Phanerochaete carnosa HHB-10118-sp]